MLIQVWRSLRALAGTLTTLFTAGENLRSAPETVFKDFLQHVPHLTEATILRPSVVATRAAPARSCFSLTAIALTGSGKFPC